MAGSNYNQRAEDKLCLLAHVRTFLSTIEKNCKESFAKTVGKTVIVLSKKKQELESSLEALCKTLSKVSFFKRFSIAKQIRAIKSELTSINTKIVDWINSTYRHIGLPTNAF